MIYAEYNFDGLIRPKNLTPLIPAKAGIQKRGNSGAGETMQIDYTSIMTGIRPKAGHGSLLSQG